MYKYQYVPYVDQRDAVQCNYVRTSEDSMEKVVVDLLRSCRGVALELEAGGVVGAPPHDRDLHGEYLHSHSSARSECSAGLVENFLRDQKLYVLYYCIKQIEEVARLKCSAI